ncbi:MAG: nuclear transport factor 2 family protein [Victivallales bacterium]|nr:nuclear transport factor 2 family protein [Victivallales bacterium]
MTSIVAMEESLRDAMLHGDADRLAVLLADDLVFIGPDGGIATKAIDLACHRSGREKITAITPSDRRIQDFGSIAVVTVRIELQGTFDGNSLDGKYRYQRVWAERDGQWQVVAGSVSPIRGE